MFGLFRKNKDKSGETETKPVPVQERRVYVIDFDRTITILHTGALAYGNELEPTFVQKNVKKGFPDFIKRIKTLGHRIYIASYSDDTNVNKVDDEALSGHVLIKYYMDIVFGRDQNIFTVPQKNRDGEAVSDGNIIASNSQDYKKYHLDRIIQLEGLDRESPEDMRRIYLIEDDENVVRYFMERGCTTLVPYSASRSADTAATKTLFTSYMPESFIN